MQTHHISGATAIPLLLVLAASVACWAGIAAVANGLIQTWSMSGAF